MVSSKRRYGLVQESLTDLYWPSHAGGHEGELDRYDGVFLHVFRGAEKPAREWSEDLLAWLDNPVLPEPLTGRSWSVWRRARLQLKNFEAFEERVKEKRRHVADHTGSEPVGRVFSAPAERILAGYGWVLVEVHRP